MWHVDAYWFVTDPYTDHRGGDYHLFDVINGLNLDVDFEDEMPNDDEVIAVLREAIDRG